MEAVFFAIVVLVAIFRGLYQFARWVIQTLARLNTQTGRFASPQPMAPRATAQDSGTRGAAPLTDQTPPSPTSLPSALSSDSDGTGVRGREAMSAAGVPTATGSALTDADLPPPIAVEPLFGTTSDLVRAIILREALGPPLSQRKRRPLRS